MPQNKKLIFIPGSKFNHLSKTYFYHSKMIRKENSFSASQDTNNSISDDYKHEHEKLNAVYSISSCYIVPLEKRLSSEPLSEDFFNINGIAEESRQKCIFTINSLKKFEMIKEEVSNECSDTDPEFQSNLDEFSSKSMFGTRRLNLIHSSSDALWKSYSFRFVA